MSSFDVGGKHTKFRGAPPKVRFHTSPKVRFHPMKCVTLCNRNFPSGCKVAGPPTLALGQSVGRSANEMNLVHRVVGAQLCFNLLNIWH